MDNLDLSSNISYWFSDHDVSWISEKFIVKEMDVYPLGVVNNFIDGM